LWFLKYMGSDKSSFSQSQSPMGQSSNQSNRSETTISQNFAQVNNVPEGLFSDGASTLGLQFEKR
jgi:hypothetical protein